MLGRIYTKMHLLLPRGILGLLGRRLVNMHLIDVYLDIVVWRPCIVSMRLDLAIDIIKML